VTRRESKPLYQTSTWWVSKAFISPYEITDFILVQAFKCLAEKVAWQVSKANIISLATFVRVLLLIHSPALNWADPGSFNIIPYKMRSRNAPVFRSATFPDH
jgi:hypothetical protein